MDEDLISIIKECLYEKMSEDILSGCFNNTYTCSSTSAHPLTAESIISACKTFEECKPPPPKIEVYENAYLTETIQYRLPRKQKRKNKRWIKKFKKKYTKTVASRKIFHDKINGRIYCHPIVAYNLRKSINNGDYDDTNGSIIRRYKKR